MTLGQKIRADLEKAKLAGEVACIMLNPVDWFRYREACAAHDHVEPETIERLTMDNIPIMPSETVGRGNVVVY